MGRGLCALCAAVWLGAMPVYAEGSDDDTMDYYEEGVAVTDAEVTEIPARSAILMDAASGRVLFEKNADEPMPPASMTKIMTLLLTFEALEDGTLTPGQTVTASENAASMGGTQIWLEPGEEMLLEDLIKAAAVGSANDAAMALGEAVSGSETAFVSLMNERAKELGMANTRFENPTGLDADGHLSTARDIALMSRELMKYPDALAYTSIWMDTLRGGETALVNTNKLVRFYPGCVGLKTGTTDGAGSCLSAAAVRDGLSLIAVSMGSATSADRFRSCRILLDYGFSAFESYQPAVSAEELTPAVVTKGTETSVSLVCGEAAPVLVPKGRSGDVRKTLTLETETEAPVEKGQSMGRAVFTLDGEILCELEITAAETVGRMDFRTALAILWRKLLGHDTQFVQILPREN
ncbi:MAG: D-alanyl-D-alanine carboxypeptidase [Oscillospiraceae bacterium]|nr:D-alanyl-D-alanine carboxypeptidase [Oscillospiraceae bacterium]